MIVCPVCLANGCLICSVLSLSSAILFEKLFGLNIYAGLVIPEPLGRELIWIGHWLGCDYSFNSQDLSENKLPKPLLSRNKIFYALTI